MSLASWQKSRAERMGALGFTPLNLKRLHGLDDPEGHAPTFELGSCLTREPLVAAGYRLRFVDGSYLEMLYNVYPPASNIDGGTSYIKCKVGRDWRQPGKLPGSLWGDLKRMWFGSRWNRTTGKEVARNITRGRLPYDHPLRLPRDDDD